MGSRPLKLIFDTIATQSSAEFCAECLSSAPNQARVPTYDASAVPNSTSQAEETIIYVSLLPISLPYHPPHHEVREIFFLGYTAFNSGFEIEGEWWDGSVEDFSLSVKFLNLCEKLLQQGLIKPHPVILKDGGLIAVLNEGLDLMRKGVSGGKLVYRIKDE